MLCMHEHTCVYVSMYVGVSPALSGFSLRILINVVINFFAFVFLNQYSDSFHKHEVD